VHVAPGNAAKGLRHAVVAKLVDHVGQVWRKIRELGENPGSLHDQRRQKLEETRFALPGPKHVFHDERLTVLRNLEIHDQ
jgi:hypothetical protein